MITQHIKDVNNYLNEHGQLDYLTFNSFSKMYIMSTENIKDFVNSVDCEGKDVLTVAASGDQALNTILNGAKNITCFDSNILSFYQVKLKIAAVRTLSFDEFCRFFYVVDNNLYPKEFFNLSSFDKVCRKLDDESISFFTMLYKFCNWNTNAIKDRAYYHFSINSMKANLIDNYMDIDGYSKLASILNHNEINIDFLDSDFTELCNKLGDKSFDLILLSNISDYINKMYDDPLIDFYTNINSLINYLNYLGTMQVGYIYTNPDRSYINSDFSNKYKRRKVFTTDKFHTKLVSSYDYSSYEACDEIITYQKVL